MQDSNPFVHRDISQSQKDQITSVRLAFQTVYAVLNELPPSREKALAVTKLEESAMWANKGISFGPSEG